MSYRLSANGDSRVAEYVRQPGCSLFNSFNMNLTRYRNKEGGEAFQSDINEEDVDSDIR